MAIATFTWPAISDGGNTVAYMIRYGTSPNGPYPNQINVGNRTRYSIEGLIINQPYYAQVAGINGDGVVGIWSPEAMAIAYNSSDQFTTIKQIQADIALIDDTIARLSPRTDESAQGKIAGLNSQRALLAQMLLIYDDPYNPDPFEWRSWQAVGNVLKATPKPVTGITYDSNNMPVAWTAGGRDHAAVYDGNGRISRVTHSSGAVATVTFNGSGRVTGIT